MRSMCLILLCLTGTVGCAPVAPGGSAATAPRKCFWPSEVTRFSDAGPDRALVHLGSRATWELTLSNGCPDIDWALQIGIRARGGERICPGRPAELFVPEVSGRGARACLVRAIRRLSDAEADAAEGRRPR